MIDTTKFYCIIDENTKDKIKFFLDLTSKINLASGEVFYNFTSGGLVGSYDTRLNISVEDTGVKYNLVGCILVVEGSFHKWSKGYNSHNGYYNLNFILSSIIRFIELKFNVKLPRFYRWYLQRIDISICYNLDSQNNVKNYINNCSAMNYPRRKTRFFCNESLYFSGSSTTLKIYNKYAEFLKHDSSRFKNSDFDLSYYLHFIKGFLRFECEIKKKKLVEFYQCKNIFVYLVCYNDLFSIWRDEFMKLYRINDNCLSLVRDNNDVKNRLFSYYKKNKANNLYGFYLSIINEGYKNIFTQYDDSTFYRKIKDLKLAGIDFSQNSFIVSDLNYDTHFINFNPFVDFNKEVV